MSRRLLFVPLLLVILAAGGAARMASGDARRSDHRPTIAAAPNPATAGDPVIIFGHVPGAGGGVGVTLWHRLPDQHRFSAVDTARTDARGNYVIVRRPGVVLTNRRWYVTAPNGRSHSCSPTTPTASAGLVVLRPPPA